MWIATLVSKFLKYSVGEVTFASEYILEKVYGFGWETEHERDSAFAVFLASLKSQLPGVQISGLPRVREVLYGVSIGSSLYDEEGAKIVPDIMAAAEQKNVRGGGRRRRRVDTREGSIFVARRF